LCIAAVLREAGFVSSVSPRAAGAEISEGAG